MPGPGIISTRSLLSQAEERVFFIADTQWYISLKITISYMLKQITTDFSWQTSNVAG